MNNTFKEKFPTIQSSAKIIGLYFCSSWCPDCISATPGLVKVMQDMSTSSNSNNSNTKLIDIFYISSDRSKNEMIQYKPHCFLEIPYEDNMVRSSLKNYYGTCAMKELSELNMTMKDRKHGIPTLILINNSTGQIISENGLSYISTSSTSEKVLADWEKLL